MTLPPNQSGEFPDATTLILSRGMPATVLSAEGVLPCVVAILHPRHRRFQDAILSRFGGFWMGSPSDALDGVFLWVAYGRSASIAAHCALALPEHILQTVDGDAIAAWRALAAFAELWRTVLPDPVGHRPKDTHQAMMREARRMERLLTRVMPEYPVMIQEAERAISQMIDGGTLPDELTRPTVAELGGLPEGDGAPITIPLGVPRPPRFHEAIDPAELQEALRALAAIEAMPADERERRVRRRMGGAPFNPETLGSTISHRDLLFMDWVQARWRDQPSQRGSDWGWRTISAFTMLNGVKGTVMGGQVVDPADVEPHLLWALATAKMPEGPLPKTADELFGVTPMPARGHAYDEADLMGRMLGDILPSGRAVKQPRKTGKQGKQRTRRKGTT